MSLVPGDLHSAVKHTGGTAEYKHRMGSNMSIDWPPMTERGPQVTESAIDAFETQLGTKLPDDYRAFLLEVNGGQTELSHTRFVLVSRKGRRDWTRLNSRGGRVGRYLVTRGRSRRGLCRAQFRSAPTCEHTLRRAASSPIGRVRAARGLFEHGMAHRRASLRGLALSPPLHRATHYLLCAEILVS